MIKPEELRIGNFVEAPNDTYIDRAGKIKDYCFKVCLVSKGIVKINIGFDAQQRFEENPIYSYGFEDLKPIPLTEDWLERFGFTKDDNRGSYHFRTVSIKRIEKKGVTDRFGQWGFTVGLTPLRWVRGIHQLQNLYFALTGKELELKN